MTTNKRHYAQANGTHAKVNRVGIYTLILDIYWPASSDKKIRALLQTHANNIDLFFNQPLSGGVGVNDYYHGEITADKWHRIDMGVDGIQADYPEVLAELMP